MDHFLLFSIWNQIRVINEIAVCDGLLCLSLTGLFGDFLRTGFDRGADTGRLSVSGGRLHVAV